MKKRSYFALTLPESVMKGESGGGGAEVQPVSQSVSSEEKIPPVPSTASRSGLQGAAKRLMLI